MSKVTLPMSLSLVFAGCSNILGLSDVTHADAGADTLTDTDAGTDTSADPAPFN